MAEVGVLCHATAATRIRLVTHSDVSAEQIERALEAIAGVLESLAGR
jgi:hypothetical protein